MSSEKSIPAVKVRQWLTAWDSVKFDGTIHRGKPDPYFYVFSLTAAELKALSDIRRRTTEKGTLRSQDLGIQRRHDKKRSSEIWDFVQRGLPLSRSGRGVGTSDVATLRMPGWLPTSVVVNILREKDKRDGTRIAPSDVVHVKDTSTDFASIILPEGFSGANWKPTTLYPIEVIDGQHRLWAFEGRSLGTSFELPVVAFHGLDLSWQAYLFWTINVTPKRINASLAYDLYPLLRQEDWLEKRPGPEVYREARSQELVEALWANRQSPWFHRINMLGEPGHIGELSQSAWVRSVSATYLRAWDGRRVKLGGLFGSRIASKTDVIPWTRVQQAAFLIGMGIALKDAVADHAGDWARGMRRTLDSGSSDPAFFGPYTLFNADPGVRGLLFVSNDLCYVRADSLSFSSWRSDDTEPSPVDEKAVAASLVELRRQKFWSYVTSIVDALATYDWRSAAAPDLNSEEQRHKLALRGSGGYAVMRLDLLDHLVRGKGDVSRSAKQVMSLLKGAHQ